MATCATVHTPTWPMRASIHAGDDNLPNLALRQAVYASSVYLWGDTYLYPGYAVDGVTEYPSPLDASTLSLFHSEASDSAPWISVDLGAVALVKRVVIVNRCDCCPERLQSAELRIGNVSITRGIYAAGGGDTRNITGNLLVWRQDADVGMCASKIIAFDTPKVGRWVTLQNKYPLLQVSEIQVFGYYAASAVCANVLPGTGYDCRYWVFRQSDYTCTLKRDEGAGPGFFMDPKTVAGGVRPVALLGTRGAAPWYYNSFVDPSAQWIWSRGGASQSIPGAPTNPVTTFSYIYTAASVMTAYIYIAADDYVWIYINGMQTGTSRLIRGWDGTPIPPVPVTLQKGPNLIQMRVQNRADRTTAGVIMSLQDSSGRVLARSNASWVWSERAIRVEDTPPPVRCMRTQFSGAGKCTTAPTGLRFWGYGRMVVVYRVVYIYADGTRSPSSTRTMSLTERTYCAPWVYVEFSSPIATLLASGPPGKPRTGIMLQRSGAVTCDGSPPANWDTNAFIDIVRLDSTKDYGDGGGCRIVSDSAVHCLDFMRAGYPSAPPVSAWRWAGGSTAPTPTYSSLGRSAPALVFYGSGGFNVTYSLSYNYSTGYRSVPSPNRLWAAHANRSQPSIFVEFSVPLLLGQGDSVVLQRYEEDWGLVDVDRIGAVQANGSSWLLFTDSLPPFFGP
ncbi:hypothetical protein VOLCADRAFT_89941 [Volvox carteri f. nagariensis]|uniref:Fucolectin tachylectin-4 pentraxin-1 domain-containing protein n=1 Tax=Volvox carteri f. nagariensis TaxID=3068 RepID=D8TT25_VOLCA|nr:uncharacterized protein VOLCADRAFT_89941 [Volvox carteri f. nagariensis]EFJ49479.1 hypothetical protein VOLCADRAFT_89941 [Volvox carteri f. nagariensis]|eukprot:XP_002949460.1 hypothetical protein VOLCADRAFT_89941 [Volvox carteri f. nagariensis]